MKSMNSFHIHCIKIIQLKENISQIKDIFDNFVASDISRPFCKAYQMNLSIKISKKSIYQLTTPGIYLRHLFVL